VFKGLRGRVQDVAVKRMPHRMTSKKALARLRDEVQVCVGNRPEHTLLLGMLRVGVTCLGLSSVIYHWQPSSYSPLQGIDTGTSCRLARLLMQHVGNQPWMLTQVMERVSFDRNIVQYYGAWLEQDDAPFLVMEYMEVRASKAG